MRDIKQIASEINTKCPDIADQMNEFWGICNHVGCGQLAFNYNETHGYICTKCKLELCNIIPEVQSALPGADIDTIIATYMRTPKGRPLEYDD